MLRRTLPAGIAALAAMLLSGPAPAVATTSTNSIASGQVTLFQNPDFTGSTQMIRYLSCDPQLDLLAGAFSAYDNRPAPGCRVVAINAARPFELCAGRSVVPGPPLASAIRIEPGTSIPCFPREGA
jgi:hypothetical protein